MKHIKYMFPFFILIFLVCFCFNIDSESPASQKEDLSVVMKAEEQPINYAHTLLDPVTVYKNEQEIINDERVTVVSGKIIATDTFVSNGMVFTDCTTEIISVHKGSIETETIHVLELGGKLNEEQAIMFANKDGYDSFPEGLNVVYSGYKISVVGDCVVFFLTQCDDDMVTDVLGKRTDLYYVAGAVQGKFTLKDNYYVSGSSYNHGKLIQYTTSEFQKLLDG